ncbi:hypothetical protein CSKR_108275 [Clonorchis sinensis]|uniref:Uncharacterized protein n=1 Tax=Clonorchis sinensis TaxID=79923 RepID=A0A8T1MKW2_CLOSI|nr:hypothetical protein CSKR_108275 [Clonorchis sinensis]
MPAPTTNSALKRDPITGLGTVANGAEDKATRSRTQSLGRRIYNRKLISWDADEEPNKVSTSNFRPNRAMRNPIALTGELGAEVDSLRTTSRPRLGTPREPQRDPIAGLGNFGEKEWDPIWKYNGRLRRSKSSNGIRTNPITGQNMKSFEVMLEEKSAASRCRDRALDIKRNIFTGENCSTYSVSPDMKSPSKKGTITSPRNAITGENCTSYDINSEVHTPKVRQSLKASNPLSGENVNVYTVSQEERQRPSKPYVYKNTVTGENLKSYQIIPIERNITPKPLKERQNPLSGENVKTYKYRFGESELAVKRRDLSSPLTGEGSRGRTYVVSVEEKSTIPVANGTDECKTHVRARSSGPSRNILTGENCETFMVCREMRSERLKTPLTSGTSASYNILTGS